jgi:serine/threonine protein kinase
VTSLGYPRPGERLGHFVVGRRIGGGGMGVVFEAHDEALDRQVAIKIISPHLADDPAFRERFIREARSLASLDSTHVVHVYAHGEATPEEGGRLYLVTQLIPDGDLGGLLQAYGAPPPAMALDLLAQIADGLADAHAAGLIHRDIKPANVLLRRRTDGNQAYLSDFGIARPIDAASSGTAGTTTGTMGTPTYMAPELHLGDQPSVASDVYSLGCLLWAALTGRAPYAGTSDYQIVTAHLEQPVPQLDPSSELAVEANRILRTSMAKNPAERYASAAAMRDDLRRAALLPEAPLTGPPVEESADEPAPTAASGRPPRAAVAAALAVVLVIATLGVWALALRGDADDSTAGSDPPTAGPATTAASSPTSSDSGSADPPAGGDEAKAIANFAEALVKEGGFNQEQADCVARDVVTNVGLPALVEAGFFDEDMTFLDPDLAALPEIKSALTQATITCLG